MENQILEEMNRNGEEVEKIYCDCCGCEVDSADDLTQVYNGDLVCSDCLDNDYFLCNDCGEYHNTSDMYTISVIGGYSYSICYDCYDDGDYDYCEDCGYYYNRDDMECINGNWYCADCVEEHRETNRVYNYHGFNDWRLYKDGDNDDSKYYIGAEIELEPKNRTRESDIVSAINKNINAVAMHDSSLNDGGVEVVTHPETMKYKETHKQNYINFFNDVEQVEYGNVGHSGLHFHVTRPNDDVIARVIVLLESFKEEITKLSRRKTSQLNQWSKFLTSDTSTKTQQCKYKSTKYLKDKYINNYHDRYTALNLNNSKTIEFRFFNGANNFKEFWSALQFINNLMEFAYDETKEVNTISWKDLIKGKELEEEAQRLGVFNVEKYAKDTTQILEKIEEERIKATTNTVKILTNLAKYINKEMANLTTDSIKINNIDEMINTCDSFMNNFRYKRDFLQRIIGLRRALIDGSYSFDNMENYVDSLKSNYPNNTKKYSRYTKQLEKVIKEYNERLEG